MSLITKYGFRVVFNRNISLILLISIFCYYLIIFLLSWLGVLGGIFSIIFYVGGGLALPAPVGTSSSSSWTEDPFEISVLEEPFSDQEEANYNNTSLEESMRQRIGRLEKDQSIFLLGKSWGAYWGDIKQALDNAPSQGEFQRLLAFENRDLQIRELKHDCLHLFQDVLIHNPALAENAAYNPQEAFVDFLEEIRDELEKVLVKQGRDWDIPYRDHCELKFLKKVYIDLERHGPNSKFIKIRLGG